ncbi:MAG: hypothetical protein QXN90_04985 [Zestosphaera sp.]
MSFTLADLRNRIVNHLRNYGFSIFTSAEYQIVSRLLTSLGIHRDLTIKKIPNSQYYLLEIDKRTFITECRNLARRNEATNMNILVSCVESKSSEALNKVIEKLTQATNSSPPP